MATLAAIPKRPLAPVRTPGYRTTAYQIAVIALIGAPLFYGAVRAFPLWDDGWLAMLTKESGSAILSQTMPDRPLMGQICAFVVRLAPSPPGLVAISLGFWFTLAFQAGLIWRRIFPSLEHYAPVVSCLCLSPVVVQAQYCTLLVSVPCVLTAVLSYGSSLCAIRFASPAVRFRLPALILGVGLLIAGVLISEYAVAASLSGLAIQALLLVRSTGPDRRRLRTTLILFAAVTAISYLVFLRITDSTYRPDVNPAQAGLTLRRHLPVLATDLVTGIWHTVLGAYATVAGMLGIYWDSRSTILGVALGALAAFFLWRACRPGTRNESAISPAAVAGLLAALLAALIPVVMMGRSTNLPGFGSRFLIPALPVATALTLTLALTLFGKSHIWAVVTAFGMIAGYAAVTQSSTLIHQRDLAASLGGSLRPYIDSEAGDTVAVASVNGMDYELTARAAAAWPSNLEKRLWIYDYDAGTKAFGERTACPAAPQIHKSLRRLTREGPVARLLWLEIRGERLVSVEPYCTTPEPIR